MIRLAFLCGVLCFSLARPSVRFDVGSGAVAKVAVGETFEVVMMGNPSTGYQWTLVKESAALVQVGEVRFESQGSRDAVGAPALSVFTFQAKSVGQGSLSFAYARSFEKGVAPIRTAELRYDIRQK